MWLTPWFLHMSLGWRPWACGEGTNTSIPTIVIRATAFSVPAEMNQTVHPIILPLSVGRRFVPWNSVTVARYSAPAHRPTHRYKSPSAFRCLRYLTLFLPSFFAPSVLSAFSLTTGVFCYFSSAFDLSSTHDSWSSFQRILVCNFTRRFRPLPSTFPSSRNYKSFISPLLNPLSKSNISSLLLVTEDPLQIRPPSRTPRTSPASEAITNKAAV